MSEVPRWNQDHFAELIEVDGQVLTIDMSQVESIDLHLPRDVVEGVDKDNVIVRKLGDLTTVVYVARVRSDGVKWAAR